MLVTPFRPPERRPRAVALLEPGIRACVVHTDFESIEASGATEVATLLDGLAERKFLVYVDDGLTRCRFLTDARQWTATVWNGKCVAMHRGKFKAIGLRGALKGSRQKFDDLRLFLDWARGLYRVNPASVGTMAQNLWRATLEDSLSVASDPEVSGPALFGGRQWAGEPRTYRHMAAFDISCAYPHAMWAGGPYARRLVEVDPTTELVGPGIARARVAIPWGWETLTDRPFGALPVRLSEPSLWGDMDDRRLAKLPGEALWWPLGGTWEGTWPWGELQAASELGYRVTVLQSWAPVGLVQPFTNWEELVREARRLPGAASQLGKVVSVALWGTFALDGARSSWAWDTPHGQANAACTATEPARRLPQRTMKHWAAETSSRVRRRLLMEGLYGEVRQEVRETSSTDLPSPERPPRQSRTPVDRVGFPPPLPPPVHVDTDGVIRRASAPVPEPAGSELGQWRLSKEMTTLEVRAPQLYRYTNGHPGLGGDRWHYVCSGIPEKAAVEKWKESSSRSFTSLEMPDGQVISVPAVTRHRRRVAGLVEDQRSMVEPPATFVDQDE